MPSPTRTVLDSTKHPMVRNTPVSPQSLVGRRRLSSLNGGGRTPRNLKGFCP